MRVEHWATQLPKWCKCTRYCGVGTFNLNTELCKFGTCLLKMFYQLLDMSWPGRMIQDLYSSGWLPQFALRETTSADFDYLDTLWAVVLGYYPQTSVVNPYSTVMIFKLNGLRYNMVHHYIYYVYFSKLVGPLAIIFFSSDAGCAIFLHTEWGALLFLEEWMHDVHLCVCVWLFRMPRGQAFVS